MPMLQGKQVGAYLGQGTGNVGDDFEGGRYVEPPVLLLETGDSLLLESGDSLLLDVE